MQERLLQIHKKIANKRLDFMHKQSCTLIESSKRVITEKLAIKDITKSPKAKIDENTENYLLNGVARKAGLNRSILDTSPSQFLQLIPVKAEEAGYKSEELETRELKPIQRCAACLEIVKKELVVPEKLSFRHC